MAHAIVGALLTCADCGMSRALMVVSVGLLERRGSVGALRGRGVSADARAYFGPRLGVVPGRVHDVMGVPADDGAAAQSCEAFPRWGRQQGLGNWPRFIGDRGARRVTVRW